MKTGAQLIEEERERQIFQEGWTSENDDQHTDAQLAWAARCYIGNGIRVLRGGGGFADTPLNWPWAPEWWKPSETPIRDLVKAGALIAAEIDRLQRLANDQTEQRPKV